MRIGTMFLGRVEALENESVQTKFFVLGVPMFPVASFYATSEHANGVTGFEIPVHGTSVLAGYLRFGSFAAGAIAGLFAWIEHRSYDPQHGLFALTAICTLVWIASMFLLGRLSETEKARRLRLRRATGLGAPPELLPVEVRSEIETKLQRAWDRIGEGLDWKERLRSGRALADEAPLLYALAEYDGDRELIEHATRAMS